MLNRTILLTSVLVLSSLIAIGCGGASVPDSPEGTVLTVAKELAGNNPGVLWDAMPASYRTDVETLVHDAAAKIDAEVYDKAFVILNKAVDVLKDKRGFILGLPLLQQGFLAMMITDQEELKDNWNEIVDVFDILASSELETLDGLKSLDVGDFLNGTGGKLMAQFEKLAQLASDGPMKLTWNELEGITVDVKSTEGDKAVIEVTVEDKGPETLTMVKVEGKWVPEEMARDWKKNIEEMKAQVAEMTAGMSTEQKTTMLAQMAGVEQIVDQLAKAETQEEFTQIVMSLMGGM